MTEIKDVVGMIFIVKAQFDAERAHACPVGQTNEKERLVYIEAKIFFSRSDVGDLWNVTVETEILVSRKVHGGRTGGIYNAVAVRRGNNGRLEFVQVGVSSIGKVGKAQWVHVVASVRLKKGVGFSNFQSNGWIDHVSAFFKLIIA
jgi:hypothetical protein